MVDQCTDKVTPWAGDNYNGWIRPSIELCILPLPGFNDPVNYKRDSDIEIPEPKITEERVQNVLDEIMGVEEEDV